MCIADMWVIIYESARVTNICYISVQGMVDVKVYLLHLYRCSEGKESCTNE